jgi:hypothetical protein
MQNLVEKNNKELCLYNMYMVNINIGLFGGLLVLHFIITNSYEFKYGAFQKSLIHFIYRII